MTTVNVSRVLTYKNQPDNVGARRLGEACSRASEEKKVGDYIDRGLVLLRELEAKGFGVVALAEQQASRESRMVAIERDANGLPTVWCDPEIADVVKALNDGGVITVASCSGHGHRPAVITMQDGRYMMIVEQAEWEVLERLWPTDINGQPAKAEQQGDVGRDEARLALFRAIEAIQIGNKTDDKLLLEELRKAGYWITRLQASTAPPQEAVYLFRRKGQNDFVTCGVERYEELSDKPHLFETRVLYEHPPANASKPKVCKCGDRAQRRAIWKCGLCDAELSPNPESPANDEAVRLLAECEEYLSDNYTGTSIGKGSILHRKMQAFLTTHKQEGK